MNEKDNPLAEKLSPGYTILILLMAGVIIYFTDFAGGNDDKKPSNIGIEQASIPVPEDVRVEIRNSVRGSIEKKGFVDPGSLSISITKFDLAWNDVRDGWFASGLVKFSQGGDMSCEAYSISYSPERFGIGHALYPDFEPAISC